MEVQRLRRELTETKDMLAQILARMDGAPRAPPGSLGVPPREGLAQSPSVFNLFGLMRKSEPASAGSPSVDADRLSA